MTQSKFALIAEKLENWHASYHAEVGPADELMAEFLEDCLMAATLLREAAVATTWRPIAKAPKDGSKIILAKMVGHRARPTSFWWAASGSWSERYQRWWDGIKPCGLADPNYWIPIPPLPEPAP